MTGTLPWRPNADYLGTIPTPKPGELLVYNGRRKFTAEEYDIAEHAVKTKPIHSNSLFYRKCLIITAFSALEDLLSIVTNPDLDSFCEEYCIINLSESSILATDPFVSRTDSHTWNRITGKTIMTAWTTSDPIVRSGAVDRLKRKYPKVVGAAVSSVCFSRIAQYTRVVSTLQSDFREVMVREWVCESIPTGDDQKPVRSYSIKCCECGKTDHFRNTTFGAETASEQVPKHYRNKGWKVHKKDGGDVCPDCIAAQARKRHDIRNEPPVDFVKEPESMSAQQPQIPRLKRFPTAPPALRVASKPSAPPAVAIPAQQPSRAENRAIQDALSAHYPVPEKGYANGMTDERLARDLAFPVDWIAVHRERFFGPATVIDLTPTEARVAALRGRMTDVEEKALAEIAALKTQVEDKAKAFAGTIEALRRQTSETEDRILASIDALNGDLDDLSKTMDALRAQVDGAAA